ncbi:MAG: fatty acid desaturase [Myxococcales bacterium]|nr:fatty acid desaturase [Myxococcales bacterium]
MSSDVGLTMDQGPYAPEIPDDDSPAVAASDANASGARSGKSLIEASRVFARESTGRTVWETFTTFAVLSATLAGAASTAVPLAARLALAVIAGLTIVRGFILYHDCLHGALYRGKSPFARVMRGVMWLYGMFVLTPPAVWRSSHNYHHANTAKLVGSHIGSYPTMTIEMFRRAKPAQKFMYRAVRHPLTMLFGAGTVFLFGMCLGPLTRDPKKHWDSGLALVMHGFVAAAVIAKFGLGVWLVAVLLPLMVACATGAYLFYAQHNFPGILIQGREKWSYTTAALESSSMMETGPLMAWFTGNIGYHHVHHLNPGIPFYRLPEAMASIPELQNPHKTSLRPKDIAACLRLALWDMRQKKMVGYSAAE